mgnify:CR=1 FL=1
MVEGLSLPGVFEDAFPDTTFSGEVTEVATSPIIVPLTTAQATASPRPTSGSAGLAGGFFRSPARTLASVGIAASTGNAASTGASATRGESAAASAGTESDPFADASP